MPQPLAAVLADVRQLLLDPSLKRAVAAGRRRGATPSITRAELRPVALKSGTHLQIVTDDGARPHTRNEPYGPEAAAAVDALLAEPFGNWHVEAATMTMQVRVTKKGDAQVHRSAATAGHAVPQQHDRAKQWLLDAGDPLFAVTGGTAAKRRQVDAFLRSLAATLPDDPADWPSPLRVVDLGCGNAYLTFAAYRYLTDRGAKVQVTGVDVRDDQRVRNSALADELGCAADVRFVAGTIEDARVEFEPRENAPAGHRRGPDEPTEAGASAEAGSGTAQAEAGSGTAQAEAGSGAAGRAETGRGADPRADAGPGAKPSVDFAPDLVLALHACDTATDEALARAVRWDARWVLAAPCCHHDIAVQLKTHAAPSPYGEVTRSAILRERFADVLTDTLRAALLRANGYQVDVVEFVDSAHTPRNLLLRARRTGTPAPRDEYDALTAEWGVTPALEKLLS